MAVKEILKFYDGYISKLCLRPFYHSESGKIIMQVDEELKGADQVKSTFLSEIGRMFEAALTVPEIAGIIINPWNRTIMLDKHLIRIIMPD